jgi:hypothetical protein
MPTKTDKADVICIATQGWVDPLGLQECPLLPDTSPPLQGAGTFPLPQAKETFVDLLQASPLSITREFLGSPYTPSSKLFLGKPPFHHP